jgi:hypothetical protein
LGSKWFLHELFLILLFAELGTADCHYGGSNCGLSVPRKLWPPALRELKLTGAHLSLALLYGTHSTPCASSFSALPWRPDGSWVNVEGMPTTLESLDISRCTMWPVPVDMDACLPRLQTLRADGAALHYQAYYAYHKEYVWCVFVRAQSPLPLHIELVGDCRSD